MGLIKKRILSVIAILCVVVAFFFRFRNEQQTLVQICPAISSANEFGMTLEAGGETIQSDIGDGQILKILSETHLKHGKKTNSAPDTAFRINVAHEDGNWLIVIGADHSVTVAKVGDLAGTRTFWVDPSGALFDAIYGYHLSTGGKAVAGYVSQTEIANIHFTNQDFAKVDSIRMTNAHNGRQTFLTDGESTEAICAFLHSIEGKNGISGRGYYEGTYELVLYEGETEIFSMGFGDSDAFYYGEYGDGYPVRFELDGITIEEVTTFLRQFDAHPVS